MRPMPISRFVGSNRFLSNFFVEPDGSHVEGEYQAHKFLPVDWSLAEMTPPNAKTLGGSRPGMRDDWEAVKVGIMAALLYGKFTDHPALRAALLATGHTELIEGNHWGDTFWGVCNNEGKNMLGHLLMNLREELRRD